MCINLYKKYNHSFYVNINHARARIIYFDFGGGVRRSLDGMFVIVFCLSVCTFSEFFLFPKYAKTPSKPNAAISTTPANGEMSPELLDDASSANAWKKAD